MSCLRNGLAGIALAVASGAVFPGVLGATEFASPKSYAVGTNPHGIAIADFNGDGKPDIAVINSGSNNVSILLGNGDGTFRPATNFDVGNNMSDIFAGDFNGDGKTDLVAFLPGNASGPVNGEVRVLLGNGDGTFRVPVLTNLTAAAAELRVGDLNGDKRTDLILRNTDAVTGAVTLQVLIGKGDGTFAPATVVPSDVQNADFVVADFNKDGKLDLAVAVPEGVQVLIGRGDGTFVPGGTATVSTGYATQTMVTGDFNHDGSLDLIVDSRESSCSGSIVKRCSGKQNVSVFLGNGDGTFGAEQIFAQGGYTQNPFGFSVNTELGNIVVGDFNADGKLDIAGREPLGSRLEIWLGKGDGTLSPVPAAITYPGPVAGVADLNGDSLSDLLILDSSNGNLLVFLNTSPTSGADLGINGGTVAATVGQGINLTYPADVLNAGPQDATSVTFTDTLPAGATFVSATSTKGSCTQSNQKVTCVIGELPSVADAQINIVVVPTVTGAITNTMDVTAVEPDLAPANNEATQNSTVVPVYTLTVIRSGSGSGTVSDGQAGLAGLPINCGITCSAQYFGGTNINFSASADSGSFFLSWNGACAGAGPGCSVIMDSDKTVTAVFALGAKLTVAFSGGGTGTVTSSDNTLSCSNPAGTCSSLYKPGSSISLAAAPSGNSVFSGWSGACTGADPNQCSVAMNSDQTVTAAFNRAPDFSLSPAAASLTAAAGNTVNDVISISEQGGFSSSIQLACSVIGPAPMPTCSLSPSNIPPGANSPTSTLSIAAPVKSAYLPLPRVEWPARTPYEVGLALGFLLLGLLALRTVIGREREPRRALGVAGSLAYVAIMLSLAACGGGSSPPPPQTFTVTVNATSGALQHTTTVSVTVP